MKKILLYLILIMAVTMAGTVAYVSVSGLLKVFTGAGTMGLILFGAIEIAKIIATSAIHTYGKKIGWLYNTLLSIAIFISMLITSMGIYGFLSSSYKESFSKMESIDSQVTLLETKRDGYQAQLNVVTSEKNTLDNTVGELSKGLANNVIQYKDSKTGQLITSTSTSTRKALEKQLDNSVVRQEALNLKSNELNTNIFNLENQILETKLGNESASELSTLKYLSDITGKSMDEVMKWFILLLIIIGDPMAVLMIIVFNKVVRIDDVEMVGDEEKNKPELNSGEKEVMNPPLPKDFRRMIRRKINGVDEPSNDAVIDALNDTINTENKTPIIEEVNIPNPITDSEILQKMISRNKGIVEPLVTETVEPEIDEPTTNESQIDENISKVKQLKREVIIPRGSIIESDVVKDKRFSVDVPEPNTTRLDTNKEIGDDGHSAIFFNRKRGDELRNED